jgi:hypothetical protein
MSHSSLRKHRHYHSRAAMKAAVQHQHQGSRDVWSSYGRVPRTTPSATDSLSLSPTSTPSPSPTHLTTPTHHPPLPPETPRPNALVIDQAPAPTMHAPHNIFAPPSTSPAHLAPHTILAILLLIIVLTLAATWTLLVCIIHYRGTTTGLKQHASTSTHSSSPPPSTHSRAWPLNPFKRARSSKHKYEALEHCDADAEDGKDSARALSSALELRSLKSAGGMDGSPLNPFLVEPGRDSDGLGRGIMRRGEEEWALRHRAFFGGGEGGENSPASLLGAGAERGTDGVQDDEALLAGAAGSLVLERGEFAWRGGWVDWGLGAVDGAVDRLTARIVRWTDEGELVLPIAEG